MHDVVADVRLVMAKGQNRPNHPQQDNSMSPNAPLPPDAPKRVQPESFRARNLQASLTVRDLPKSVAWYRDVVGFYVEREYQRDGQLAGAILMAGSVRIMLNQDDGAKGRDRVLGEGFSLQFTTAQSIDDIANRIRVRGGTLETEPADMPWGARVFRVRDPDGYNLVISSPHE
ncbi:MAG TPA: VOC family protein [Longimicrobiales bacterium]